MLSSPTTPFPLYLLPSLPFRRRSSATSTSTTSTIPSPSSSPPQPTGFLSQSPTSHLRCTKCLTDLIPVSSIISKGFTGRHGRAYLVGPPAPPSSLFSFASNSGTGGWHKGNIPNTHTHKAVPRQLVTGAHTVADISCTTCNTILGWKYVEAKEEGQKYKVGKFILETKRVVKASEWDDVCDEEELGIPEDQDVEFDSQDEDECEDLFSGIWTPELARRRRKNKSFGRN